MRTVRHSQVINTAWLLWQNDDGTYNNEQVTLALLMDIRAELKKLNTVMQCPNVAAGFRALAGIVNDEKRFKRRVAAAVRRKLKEKQR